MLTNNTTNSNDLAILIHGEEKLVDHAKVELKCVNTTKKRKSRVLLLLGLASLVILMGFLLIFLLGFINFTQGEKDCISGKYKLQSRDHRYPEYLRSLDLIKPLVDMIANSSEMLEIRKPHDPDERWLLIISTDHGKKGWRFNLREKVKVSVSEDHTSVTHLCDMPEANVINCRSVSPAKGWSLNSKLTFQCDGSLFEEVTNLEKGSKSIKTFKKLPTTYI